MAFLFGYGKKESVSGHNEANGQANNSNNSNNNTNNSNNGNHNNKKKEVKLPLITESSFGMTIGGRTAALPGFRELGPPDLVYVSKYNKHTQKETGFYQFVTGLDVSSDIAPIAYLSTLNLQTPSSSSSHPNIYTYCTYNPFSRCDVRIRVEIDNLGQCSSRNLQLIPNDRNSKIMTQVPQEIWDELQVAAMVRSIMTSLDLERKLPGLVELPLTQSVQHAKQLLANAVKLIPKSAIIGCDSLAQRPSMVQNFLVDSIIKLTELTNLFEFTIELITSLIDELIVNNSQAEELNLIIVKLYFIGNLELKGVKLLNKVLTSETMINKTLFLNEQVKFLIQKQKFEMALKVAKYSVNSSPTEFDSWLNLAKVYILQENYSMALIALNSTPMYITRTKDLVLIGAKDTFQLPVPPDLKLDEDLTQVFGTEVDNLIRFTPKYEIEVVDPALIRVNQQNLRGTYKEVYNLLISIIDNIGWDELLRIRSKVFIMDDEYKVNFSTTTLSSNQKSLAELNNKRLCERWLDNLFLVLYEDLRIILIVENELATHKQLKHSSLEWELIGVTAYRTQHFKSCIASLRTAINAKYDIISANILLKLYYQANLDFKEYNHINFKNHKNFEDIELSLDQILDIVLSTVVYHTRFYNEFDFMTLLFLKYLTEKNDVDFIRNKVKSLTSQEYQDDKSVQVFDSLLNLIEEFSKHTTS